MKNPLSAFSGIRDFYITYLETAFRIGNDEIQARRRQLLEQPGTLCTDLQIEPIPFYESAGFKVEDIPKRKDLSKWLPGFTDKQKEAWAALVLCGLMEREREEAETFPTVSKNELYSHQAEMLLRGVSEGAPGIVASGTGSGKTESFLLPIFAMLTKEAIDWPAPSNDYRGFYWWRDPTTDAPYENWTDVPSRPSEANPSNEPFKIARHGESEGRAKAVRALILYPMNALVEDQMVRLRKALDSDFASELMRDRFANNRIFFGRYTSATPVTGLRTHPRLSPSQHLEDKRNSLERLFDALSEMDRTQSRCTESGELDLRFNFENPCGSELVTRWDMQETPPDILITNTSMLSAILTREVDDPIIEKTRRWIDEDPKSYFFLVLDELHLNRGAAGTEISYLVKSLLFKLGLHKPENARKLRILSSSASLPLEGEQGERSVKYLWDMFGRNGTGISASSELDIKGAWKQSIVTGRQVFEVAMKNEIPSPKKLSDLSNRLEIAVRDLKSTIPRGFIVEIADALGHEVADAKSDVDLTGSVCKFANKVLLHGCKTQRDGNPVIVATPLSNMAENIFGSTSEDSQRALHSLFLIRGLADIAKEIWDPKALPTLNSFRFHSFFRSPEGLFSAPRAHAIDSPMEDRAISLFGNLTVERGRRFFDDGSSRSRFFELLYCECCGTLFFGGQRGSQASDPLIEELLPTDADPGSLPEAAKSQLFEKWSAMEFAVFWPSEAPFWPFGGTDPSTVSPGGWRRAILDPFTGIVEAGNSDLQGKIPGYLYIPFPATNWPDSKLREIDAPGTAMPFDCPRCEQSYEGRNVSIHRSSPIRNFRAGFAKTTQLLATELYSKLSENEDQPKLICFSDSRQDAAKAALDVESRHHEDLRREILARQILRKKAQRRSLVEIDGERTAAASRATSGKVTDIRELSQLIEKIKELEAEYDLSSVDCVPLSEIADIAIRPDRILAPLLRELCKLGTHPIDPAGISLIPNYDPLRNQQTRYAWHQFFVPEGDSFLWRTHPQFQGDINLAMGIVSQDFMQLCGSTLFNKTYFSFEECGLAYPCLRGKESERADLSIFDATIRLLTDQYRFLPNAWGSDPKPWIQVPPRNKIRRWLRAGLGGGDENQLLGTIIQRLDAAGHQDGRISIGSIFLKPTDEADPYWRCERCSRVHLHRGNDHCTRCFAPLPQDPAGQCLELRQSNFLSKRVLRGGSNFRMRCEELTGMTDNPSARLRRFKGIFLDRSDGAPPSNSMHFRPADSLDKKARTIDLLSVTTTMEVGVDIGSLRGIFQANMPPQRFNYQQRVGRAGRRGQAFSFVLTVCRSKSHDLFYFNEPQKITGDQPPPPFLTKSHPIIGRRLIRKMWLVEALRHLRQTYPVNWPADTMNPGDMHGEFMKVSRYLDGTAVWQPRLIAGLTQSTGFRDAIAAWFSLDSVLPTDRLLEGVDPDSFAASVRALERAEFGEKGVAESLAETGALPMYGMPTRTRLLYTDLVRQSPDPTEMEWKWRSMDRELELSIFEFTPGRTLYKDKTRLKPIGFVSSLGPTAYERRGSIVNVNGNADPFSPVFRLLQCDLCGTWLRLPRALQAGRQACASCRYIMRLELSTLCKTPSGYISTLQPVDSQDQADASSGSKISYAEGVAITPQADGNSNISVSHNSGIRTYRLNKGPEFIDQNGNPNQGFECVGRNFEFPKDGRRIRINGVVVPREYQFEINGTTVQTDPTPFWLASSKTTDSIFISPRTFSPNIDLERVTRGQDGRVGIRAGAISALNILISRAALELDSDPEEFEALEPRRVQLENGAFVPMLQFSDTLINGSGLCERLAEQKNGKKMLVTLIEEMLLNSRDRLVAKFVEKEHRKSCDHACYVCLQRYSNQQYHGLLDWRLGISFLRVLFDQHHVAGLDGDFSAPELLDWPMLANTYCDQMLRLGDRTAQKFESDHFRAVKLHAGSSVWGLIVHPFWNLDAIRRDYPTIFQELSGSGREPKLLDTFSLSRRLVHVRNELSTADRGP